MNMQSLKDLDDTVNKKKQTNKQATTATTTTTTENASASSKVENRVNNLRDIVDALDIMLRIIIQFELHLIWISKGKQV